MAALKRSGASYLLLVFVLGACAPMATPERTAPEDEPPAAEPERAEPADDTAPDDDPAAREPTGEGDDSGADRPGETGPDRASRADRLETGADDAATEDTPPGSHEAAEQPPPQRQGDDATGDQSESDDQPAPAEREPDPARAEAARQAANDARPTPPRPERTLTGSIELTGGDAEVSESVVYFVPDEQSRPSEAASDDAGTAHAISTRDKTLEPAVLAVPTGAEVRFPNNDPILHNLFSVSPGNRFDLGVYEPGESPAVTFDEPGVVNIYCNVHHDMHAHVLVVDTPWRTRADAQGRFRLDGLPDAPGTLHVWHRQTDRWSRAIDGPVDEPFDITLPVTRPKLPPHRDKTGQPYNRRDRDPYR